MLANIPGTSTPFQTARLRIHAKIQTHMEMLPLLKDTASTKAAIGALQFALREIDSALGQANHTSAQLQTGSDTPPCLPERTHAPQLNTPHEGVAQCKWCGWVRTMSKGERISEGKRKGLESRRVAGEQDVADEHAAAAFPATEEAAAVRSAGRYMSIEEALDAVDVGSGGADDFS